MPDTLPGERDGAGTVRCDVRRLVSAPEIAGRCRRVLVLAHLPRERLSERGGAFKRGQYVLERNLGVRIVLDDAGKPRDVGVLAVDRTGPSHRVNGRL